MLIACFNFTNLSTARSLTRAKEVGLRKVVGAVKKQLLAQFLSESTLYALIALCFALGLATLVLPLFSDLSGRQLQLDLRHNASLLFLLLLLVVVVGLVAGLYPAAVLSAFRPVEVLKGNFTRSGKGGSFRKVLVTLQFAVSIALVASTVLVSQQLHFLQNEKLGFDKENVVVLTLPQDTDSARLETFKASLLSQKDIHSVAASSTVPSDQVPVNQVNDGSADLSKALSMQMLFADADFVRTMNMQVVAGRDFSAGMATDKTAGFLINEEAVKGLGWRNPQEAVGKPVQWVQPTEVLKKGTVVGVVKNFHITPLKAAVQPLVMHQFPQRYQYLYIRLAQSGAGKALASVQKAFNEFFPKQSIEYSFLDETLNNLYNSEKKLGTIFFCFSLLAIVIACLGVLGLSLYSIQQRLKEIGIRKVLGASVFGITATLLNEFVRPVLLAALIATPLAWWAMSKWLQDFAYRTHISGWLFVLTTLIVLALALLTMSIQSIRAASINPVKSLRSE